MAGSQRKLGSKLFFQRSEDSNPGRLGGKRKCYLAWVGSAVPPEKTMLISLQNLQSSVSSSYPTSSCHGPNQGEVAELVRLLGVHSVFKCQFYSGSRGSFRKPFNGPQRSSWGNDDYEGDPRYAVKMLVKIFRMQYPSWVAEETNSALGNRFSHLQENHHPLASSCSPFMMAQGFSWQMLPTI